MFFDSVRNNKRIVQIFLALITLPFAFWGIDSYVRNTGAGTDLAKVGDSKISMLQFEQAWRNQQERLRQALGENFRPETMNTPEAKLAVLNALVDQRLLLLEATRNGIGVDDAQLRTFIASIPGLQENGQFSLDRYQAALARQGLSQGQFEAQVRQELILQQLVRAIGDTGVVGQTGTDALLRAQIEERQVAEWRLPAEAFAAQVRIEPAAVEKYYQDNPLRFQVAEQARVEYLLLSLDAFLAQIKVSDAEIGAWYESHKDRYRQAEERRASHILIVANSDADKEKTKAKAEQILQEVRQSPARFADLARQYSDDPGSASKGGDLGFFGRGTMVKPFEEAVLKLRENEISGLVSSEFGWHIIQLTGLKPGKERSLGEVRAEIEDELKRQAAARQFAEAAEAFSNLVYEQPDSLQPAAERFKLTPRSTDWLPRQPDAKALAALGPLGHAKVLAALFTDDALQRKRNTEAIEIAPNTLLAARVLEHRPASRKPFDSVKVEIESLLKAQAATDLARQAGETRLRELRQGGEDKIAWGPLKTFSRQDGGKVPPPVLKTIFRAETQKLPAYTGSTAASDGYTLYKIVKVDHPDKVADAQRQALQGEYGKILGQEDFAAYLAALRLRYKIDINSAALSGK